MRPLARQSARLASHSRASSQTRIRPSSIPRHAPQQHLRAFNSSTQRCLALDPRPPAGWSPESDEQVRRLREEQRQQEEKERKATASEEESEDGSKAKASGTGEVKRLKRRERKLAMAQHGMPEVPKPPPVPEWFLKHNVFLARDVASEGSSEKQEFLRCIDTETGHTLFTVPYFEPRSEPADPTLLMTVGGKEVDWAALGLDRAVATAASEDAREEMIIEALLVQRAKKPEEIDQHALAEILLDLPRRMQEKIFERERETKDGRRRIQKELDAAAKDKRKMRKILASTTPMGQGFFDQKYSARPDTPMKTASKSTRDWMAQKGFKSGSGSDIHPFMYPLLEVEMAVRAGLSMAQSPQHSSSFASSRVDLAIHCPNSDAHDANDALVTDVASTIGADVVRFDANDFEDLTSEYVGGGQDTPGSFSTLGYDVYDGYHASNSISDRGVFGSRNAPDEDDEFDVDEEEDEDFDEDEADRSSGNGFGSMDDLRKALSDRRHELGKVLGKMGVQVHVGGPSPFPMGSGGPARGLPPGVMVMGGGPKRFPFGSPDEVNYDEARLTALLESLIDAVKEKRSQAGAESATAEHAREIKKGNGDTTSPGGVIAKYLSGVASGTGTKTVKFEKSQASVPSATSWLRSASPGPASQQQKIIIHIRDLNDINRSSLGSAIIKRLVRIAEKRRRGGEAVIVIGTSAQDRVDSMFMSGPQEDSAPFRTITMPALFKANAQDVQRLTAAMQQQAPHIASPGDAKIESINLRHIQSMLRRLRPDQRDGAVDLRTKSANEQIPMAERERLMERVLSLDQVQRLVLTAIGLAESHARSDIVHPMHIALATHLVTTSDQVANAAEQEGRKKEDLMNPLRRGTASKDKDTAESGDGSSGKSKAEEIKGSCNPHETKLLTGVVDAKNIKTGFADVHAAPETIEALKTLTTLSLLRPEAFTYGVLAADRLPGLLLYGPPGTGKTLLAKAVAKESKATVLEISGAQIYEKYVGEGEKMVRAVFSLAKKLSPCVVFIDEADAIFGSRNSAGNRNTHREIINQFLREWDGMDDHRVFMMVASNRPFDLDDAVLRRLPRRLLVDLPVSKDRESILRIHLKGEQLDGGVDLAKLAEQTPFYSGSDLKNLCVAAALACVREENDLVARNTSNPDPDFKLPEKRTLSQRHFDIAVKEISASISEDMTSLTAIRKFDEQYGDRKGRRRKSGYGFGMDEGGVDEMSVRVRPGEAAAPPP